MQLEYSLGQVVFGDRLHPGTLTLHGDHHIHGMISAPNLFLIPELGHVIAIDSNPASAEKALKPVSKQLMIAMLRQRSGNVVSGKDSAFFPSFLPLPEDALPDITVYVAFVAEEALQAFRDQYARDWDKRSAHGDFSGLRSPHSSLTFRAVFTVHGAASWMRDDDTGLLLMPAAFAAKVLLERDGSGYVAFDDDHMETTPSELVIRVEPRVASKIPASSVTPVPDTSHVLFDAVTLLTTNLSFHVEIDDTAQCTTHHTPQCDCLVLFTCWSNKFVCFFTTCTSRVDQQCWPS